MSSQEILQACETDALCDLFAETPCEDVFDVTMLTQEHRNDQRRKLSIPVLMRLTSEGSVGPAQARQLVDISPTGLGILSRSRLRPGQSAVVELRINNTTWSGTMKVVHCNETNGAHQVGMTVTDAPIANRSPRANRLRGRRPSATANLKQFQAEIPEAMRAYRRSRTWWGLVGTSLKEKIQQTIAALPLVEDDYDGTCERKHRRAKMNGDAHLVIPTYYNGQWLRAQISDMSEDGAGLLPFGLTVDHSQMEPASEFKISPNLPVIVGIDSGSNILWLPAEIIHSSQSNGMAMHIGVQFDTPAAREAFGA
jgi:hypothetical protein